MSGVMKSIYTAFNSNRQLIEQWLHYPRALQQEYGINPVLAGGALRDLLLGKEVGEVDMYLSMSAWRAAATSTSHISKVLLEREGWEVDGLSGEVSNSCIFEDENAGVTYHIRVLKDDSPVAKVIGEFDFGINMVGINTYGNLAISQHFVNDIDKQQITIRNERSREVLHKRYEKLSKKYQWPLVNSIGMELDRPTAGLILPPGTVH